MSYESKEHYQNEMNGLAYEEMANRSAQAEHEAEEMQQFENYLVDLLEKKEYPLYAFEVVLSNLEDWKYKDTCKPMLLYIKSLRDKFLQKSKDAKNSDLSF